MQDNENRGTHVMRIRLNAQLYHISNLDRNSSMVPVACE